MIKGWKKLTKKDREHLTRIANCFNTAAFQRTIDDHAEMERKSGRTVCFECKKIAEKLGMEPVGGWPS